MPDSSTASGPHSVSSGGNITNSTVVTGDLHIQRRLPSGASFQAPPLPEHFVPRPEVSEDLKTRLLAGTASAPGVLVVSALHQQFSL